MCVCMFVCLCLLNVPKLGGDSLMTDTNCRSCWHTQSRLSTAVKKRTVINICCVRKCVSLNVYPCLKTQSVWVRQKREPALHLWQMWDIFNQAVCHCVHTLMYGCACYICVMCFFYKLASLAFSLWHQLRTGVSLDVNPKVQFITPYLSFDSWWIHRSCPSVRPFTVSLFLYRMFGVCARLPAEL